MSKIKVELTRAQVRALIRAANAMLAGSEGEGDFLCKAAVLDRAVDALIEAEARQEKAPIGQIRPIMV